VHRYTKKTKKAMAIAIAFFVAFQLEKKRRQRQ
jgi:hypothetical protein